MKNKSQTDSYFKSILINVKILEQFLFLQFFTQALF